MQPEELQDKNSKFSFQKPLELLLGFHMFKWRMPGDLFESVVEFWYSGGKIGEFLKSNVLDNFASLVVSCPTWSHCFPILVQLWTNL